MTPIAAAILELTQSTITAATFLPSSQHPPTGLSRPLSTASIFRASPAAASRPSRRCRLHSRKSSCHTRETSMRAMIRCRPWNHLHNSWALLMLPRCIKSHLGVVCLAGQLCVSFQQPSLGLRPLKFQQSSLPAYLQRPARPCWAPNDGRNPASSQTNMRPRTADPAGRLAPACRPAHLQALRGLPQLGNHLDALGRLVGRGQQATAQDARQLSGARLHLGGHLLEGPLQQGRGEGAGQVSRVLRAGATAQARVRRIPAVCRIATHPHSTW